jgi:acyl dehydratase
MIDLDLLAVRDQIGHEVAVSAWIEITQERIAQFADATDDRQWIHVDETRAASESPWKTTIAHGFLTLSLVSALLQTAMRSQTRMVINYGVNRVRFISPVPAGSRVRGRFTPLNVEDLSDCVQVTWSVTVEREGAATLCCAVEWILRYYPD